MKLMNGLQTILTKNPFIITLFTMVLTLGTIISWRVYTQRANELKIEVVEDQKSDPSVWEKVQKNFKPITLPDQTVFIEAERLRSAVALAWGTLAVFLTKNSESLPRGEYAIYNGTTAAYWLQAMQLLPPGVSIKEGQWLQTQYGELEIRIDTKASIIEVWSQGKGSAGVPFLIQLDPRRTEPALWRGENGSPYLSTGATPARILQSGFRAERFRESP